MRVGSSAAYGIGGEKLVELADGREFSRARRRRQPFGVEGGQILRHLLAAGAAERRALAAEKGGIVAEVAPVGLDGVLGGAALGAHHFEEGVNEVTLAHSTPCSLVTTSPSLGAVASAGTSAAGTSTAAAGVAIGRSVRLARGVDLALDQRIALRRRPRVRAPESGWSHPSRLGVTTATSAKHGAVAKPGQNQQDDEEANKGRHGNPLLSRERECPSFRVSDQVR